MSDERPKGHLMTAVWKHALSVLEAGGPRLYAGVAGDEPDLLDAARAHGALAVGFRDQRAAAYAATGHARVTGRAAVVTLHSGPGFLQALTGISEAFSTLTPLIVITVASAESQRGRGGFQYVPVEQYRHGLFADVHVARSSADLDRALVRARHLAENACRAPVHVVVSAEVVQAGEARDAGDALETGDVPDEPWPVEVPVILPRHDADSLAPVVGALRSAERPVLVLGGGCRSSDTAAVRAAATSVAHSTGALVFTTASGRGAFPEDDPHFAGLIGLYAPARSARDLSTADLVLTVGSRLEETARMGWSLARSTSIVQVDNDSRSLVSTIPVTSAVLADALDFLSVVAAETDGESGPVWWTPFADHAVGNGGELLDAPTVWRALAASLSDHGFDVLAQENGLGDLWGYYAPVCTVPASVTCIAPGEQTALGFGITAGLGAALSGARVLAVGGDGAFSVNLTTLATAAETRSDVLFVVLDDGGFGWPATTRSDTALVDFEVPSGAYAVALSAGIPSERVSTPTGLDEALDRLGPMSGVRLLTVEIGVRVPFPPEGASTT